MLCLFLFALFSIASAHLCLLYPLQRTPIQNLTTIGTPDCGLIVGPCGGRNLSRPLSIVQFMNNTVHLIWQKNEDHWNSAAPGNFTFSLFDREGQVHPIGSVPDTNAPSGTVYEHEFVPAPSPHPPGIIVAVQGIYYTNNPNVNNVVFYQCADAVLQF